LASSSRGMMVEPPISKPHIIWARSIGVMLKWNGRVL